MLLLLSLLVKTNWKLGNGFSKRCIIIVSFILNCVVYYISEPNKKYYSFMTWTNFLYLSIPNEYFIINKSNYPFIQQISKKLDRVAPLIKDPPQTNFTTLSGKRRRKKMWHVTCGTWHVACGTWHVACGTWHVTHDKLHVTCDMWHMKCDTVACDTSKNFSSLALMAWE